MKQKLKFILKDLLITIILISIATFIGNIFLHLGLQDNTVVLVYILCIILISKFTISFIYSTVSSIILIYAFNYFCTVPRYSFIFYDDSYIIIFIFMGAIGLIVSATTAKQRQLKEDAINSAEEFKKLYHFNQKLISANSIDLIERISINEISTLLNKEVGFIETYKNLEDTYLYIVNDKIIRRRMSFDFDIKKVTNNKNLVVDIDNFTLINIRLNSITYGLIVINGANIDNKYMRLLELISGNIAIAIDRFIILSEKIKSDEKVLLQRQRADILRSISHDLRTPLTSIMGCIEMIIDITQQSDVKILLEDLYKDVDYLYSLIENILSLTRIQNKSLQLNKEYEDVVDIVNMVLNVAEKRYSDRKICYKMDDKPIIIYADAKLIGQVLLNLIDNAVKHTSKNEKIILSVYEKDNKAIFSIRDYGCGINEKDIDNIFEIFYIGDKNKENSNKSLGLGLSICKSIIQLHNGEISAKNTEQGAEFSFSLEIGGKDE